MINKSNNNRKIIKIHLGRYYKVMFLFYARSGEMTGILR